MAAPFSRRPPPAAASSITSALRSLDAFGCEGLELATTAAGVVIEYLKRTHKVVLPQLTSLRTYSTNSFMTLDPQTRRNLELFEGGRWGSRRQSLLEVIDFTATPMGARLLRRWVGQPLLDLHALGQRLDAVAWLHESDARRQRIRAELAEVSDMERARNASERGGASPGAGWPSALSRTSACVAEPDG